MPKTAVEKPPKPYPEFPLCAHNNGRWCKKIKGRIVYFGKWADDWDGSKALAQYTAERDNLHAGRQLRAKSNGELTLADALNAFLSAKLAQQEAGELNARGYAAYERVCDVVAATIGKQRALSDIGRPDLDRLRAALSAGKRGKVVAPNTLSIDLNRARSIFYFSNEELNTQIKYRRALKGPSVRLMREAAKELGPRMFEAAELRTIVEEAYPKMKAIVLLGINAAFGPSDCLSLTHNDLDLDGGWVNLPRGKTGTLRRAGLWPETVDAIRALRPTNDGHVFAYSSNDHRTLTLSFRRLLERLGLYKKQVKTLYSLRRTFQTVATTCNEPVATSLVMGHVANPGDMAAIYRQKVYDAPLRKVSEHVRGWYLGENIIE